MKTFSSYGPINLQYHFGSPRTQLVNQAIELLVGKNPTQGGHYFTVWAPRQTGKSWVMLDAVRQLQANKSFHAVKLELQVPTLGEDFIKLANHMISLMAEFCQLDLPSINSPNEFQELFTSQYFDKPIILVLDEFDSLSPQTINTFIGIFRNIYLSRTTHNSLTKGRTYLLHGVALLGIRAVLGVDSSSGSPFNIQRSLEIPNLTQQEVVNMFLDYQTESGQTIEQGVAERIFYETQGQPGLVSWFGELLTEKYNEDTTQPLTMRDWNLTYSQGSNLLPNNTTMNIMSKVQSADCKSFILELFKTGTKVEFSFENQLTNYLYLNGAIRPEKNTDQELDSNEPLQYIKFSCPFIQKRIFKRFCTESFKNMNANLDPFDEMLDAITPDGLVIDGLLKRYQKWIAIEENQNWVMKGIPRSKHDLHPLEAPLHFHLYRFFDELLRYKGVHIRPEFPTGNGKVDLIFTHKGIIYPMEVKSFIDISQIESGIVQAAKYAEQLGVKQITLAIFIEKMDSVSRQRFETTHIDSTTNIEVNVRFLVIYQ